MAAFLCIPFMGTNYTLDMWARDEAEVRLARKENGEDVEYGVWYSDAQKPWLQKEGEDDDE